MPSNTGRPDVTICIMGPTGTGKSSFIKLITGDKDIHVGHSQESETEKINLACYYEADGRCVTLVDTPGFDDSRDGVTDADILNELGGFLVAEDKAGRQLSGLIYMHRISDVRVGGIARRNLRMFKKLCGSDALKNVVIVTTMWDEVNDETGARRENELLTKAAFLKPLLDEGAKMMRHDGTLSSASNIMSKLLPNDATIVAFLAQLRNGGKTSDTDAGKVLDEDLNKLIAQHKKDMDSLQKELADIKNENQALKMEIEEDRNRLQAEVDRWEADKRKMHEDLDVTKSWVDRQASLVAVLGPRSTGKSSFIKLVIGDNDSNTKSQTDTISMSSYVGKEGRNVLLVDTPGFDESVDGKTEFNIMEDIAAFLGKEFYKGKKLNGVIYMHPISDNRMDRMTKRNVEMLQKLCGSDLLNNVVIVTTMSKSVAKETDAKLKAEFRTNGSLLQPLLDAGARLVHYDGSFDSACAVISGIFNNPSLPDEPVEPRSAGEDLMEIQEDDYETLLTNRPICGHESKAWRLVGLTWWEELQGLKQEYVVAQYAPPDGAVGIMFVRVDRKKLGKKPATIKHHPRAQPLTTHSVPLLSFTVNHPSGPRHRDRCSLRLLARLLKIVFTEDQHSIAANSWWFAQCVTANIANRVGFPRLQMELHKAICNARVAEGPINANGFKIYCNGRTEMHANVVTNQPAVYGVQLAVEIGTLGLAALATRPAALLLSRVLSNSLQNATNKVARQFARVTDEEIAAIAVSPPPYSTRHNAAFVPAL